MLICCVWGSSMGVKSLFVRTPHFVTRGACRFVDNQSLFTAFFCLVLLTNFAGYVAFCVRCICGFVSSSKQKIISLLWCAIIVIFHYNFKLINNSNRLNMSSAYLSNYSRESLFANTDMLTAQPKINQDLADVQESA